MSKKRKQKVVTKNSYRWWGYLATLIHYSVPIIYIISAYGLFKKGEVGLKINGYGYLIIILGFGFIKNFGNMVLEDIDKHLSRTFKRVFPPMIYIVLLVLLYFSQYWINHLIGLLFAMAVGRLAALFPYYKYDKNKDRYDRLYAVQDEVDAKENIKAGILRVK